MNLTMKIKLLFSMALISGSLAAQNQSSFTLQQAQDYAVKNAYSIKTSQIDLENAKKKIWETTAIGLPQISGSVAYQNIFKAPEMSFGPSFYVEKNQAGNPINVGADLYQFYHASEPMALGVKENITYTLSATQIIFNGEYLVGLQASRVFYQMSDQALQKS
jgi:hypothetical protein